jgi:alpha,alpha-trehalase
MKFPILNFAVLLLMVSACSKKEKPNFDFYATTLFHDVQLAAVFPDSKTFPDCSANSDWEDIASRYEQEKKNGAVILLKFVEENFNLPQRPATTFKSDSTRSLEEHLINLWPILTRSADVYDSHTSLIPLPHSYIVPGGRFSEIYYWDSYFTLLGLQASGQEAISENMLKNFAFLIDSLGHIPNGNRSYYKSRSQPPFFYLMVKELAKTDTTILDTYLPHIEKEYTFWMKGSEQLTKPGNSFARVVVMPNGTLLNRYWDDSATPRPEAYKEDVKVQTETKGNPEQTFRNLRAAAESGWDFSTRWFADEKSLSTIRTTEIIPIDLNCLIFDLEMTLVDYYKESGNTERRDLLQSRASARRQAILTFMWNVNNNFFEDYDFVNNKTTGIKSLAGMFPFFIGFPSSDLAKKAAAIIQEEFLKPGGLVTTLNTSGQQWDAPNGWAPLQWITYKAMMNYGEEDLALEVKTRWMRTNKRVFLQTGKMMEKYNVMDTTLIAGGGEYPNQDGFGWTNGVYLAFQKSAASIK